MIGGLQIRAMWREMVERDRVSDRVFNDRLLQYNSIPVELIHADLVGPRLTKDSRASWKFAGEIEP